MGGIIPEQCDGVCGGVIPEQCDGGVGGDLTLGRSKTSENCICPDTVLVAV